MVAATVGGVRRLVIVPVLLVAMACGGGDDTEAFCEDAQDIDEVFASLALDGEALPEAAPFEDAADVVDALAEDAPEEVQGDLGTIADGFRQIATELEETDFTGPLGNEIRDAAARVQAVAEDIQASADRVEAFIAEECSPDDEE
jgi:hypothetical protein